MAAWIQIPCLVALRTEFNTLSPKRDKGADGSIGDPSHTSSSDHTPDEDSSVLRNRDADKRNETHALDIDSTGPWPGTGTNKQRFHRINMRILAGEKAKWNDDKDKCRLNYMIWDGKIYDKDNNFEPRDYNGSDPHTNHAHYSARYETSCENDTRPWGVIEKAAAKPPVKEAEVAFSEDKIKVTETTGKELFSPPKKAGDLVEASVLLQLAGIHSRRAALSTDSLESRMTAMEAQLVEILTILRSASSTDG